MKKLKSTKGFTLIELLGVVVIIGILITIGSVAVASAIGKANETKVRADLKEFENSITFILTENPQLAKAIGQQPKELLRAYNEYAEADMKIDYLHCGSSQNLADGGSTISSISELTSGMQVGTYKMDPWGTPYKIYIQADNLGLTGRNAGTGESPDAEARVFIVSNGKNTVGNDSPNLLDADDVCLLVEVVNGELRVGYHNTDSTEFTKIFWFSADYDGFDESKALNINNSNTVLNMNYACLKPVVKDVEE